MGLEVPGHGRVPVARQEHGRAGPSEPLEIAVQDGDDRIPAPHPERPAGAEVVLEVHHDQGVASRIDRHPVASLEVPSGDTSASARSISSSASGSASLPRASTSAPHAAAPPMRPSAQAA